MWCAPKSHTTPVQHTGAKEKFLNAPVQAPVQQRKSTMHRCACTRIFLHHTSTPVYKSEMWCAPVFLHRHLSAPHQFTGAIQKNLVHTGAGTGAAPVCTGAYK